MAEKKVGVKLTANTTDFERKFDKAGQTAAKLGRGLSVGLAAASAAAALGLMKAVEAGASYEQKMATVKGVSRATADEFEKMNDVARRMGETTEFSASQAAEGLQFLSMAGFNATASVDALPGVLDLATAGNIELGLAADIASNALTAMRLETGELTRVNDTFVKTITTSNTDMVMMAESFKYAAPSAAAFGYEIEELSAYIGLLGNAGIQGSMAGTALAQSFLKAGDAFEFYGVNAKNADGSSKGLLEAIRLLEQRGASATDVMEIFGERAGKSVLALLGQGSGAIEKYIASINQAGGSTEELAGIMRDTFEGDFKTFKSTLESLGIDIFTEYKDDMREALQLATQFLREHKDEVIEAVKLIGDAAKWAGERFVAFVNSAQILNLVRDGELSLWEAAKMGPQEAAKYLAEYHAEQKRAPLADLVKQIQLQQSILANDRLRNDVREKHTKLLQEARDKYDMLTGGAEKLAAAERDHTEQVVDDYGLMSDGLAEYTQTRKEEADKQTANLLDQLNREGGYLELHNEDLTVMYIEENLKLLEIQRDAAARAKEERDRAAQEELAATQQRYDNIAFYTDGAVDRMVDAWVSGEDLKVTATQLASDMMIESGKGYFRDFMPLLFDGIGQVIGAFLSGGVSKVISMGDTWQAMLAQGAGYLAGAGAGILAGKALGESLYADGGWIGSNGSGVINQGSGYQDDVFLGLSNGGKTANYGMGGEFVVNRDSTSKYLSQLYAINEDRFASGGALGVNMNSPVSDPYEMAEDVNAAGFATFWSEFGKSKNVWQAIGTSILYYGGALGGIAWGKLLGPEIGDLLFKDGGQLGQLGGPVRRSFLGDLVDDIFGDLGDFLFPGIDTLEDLINDFNEFMSFGDMGLMDWANPWNWLDQLPAYLDAGMISESVRQANMALVPFMRDAATPSASLDPIGNVIEVIETAFNSGIIEAMKKAFDPFDIFGFDQGGRIEMAEGGIATRPITFGEAGNEAFLPLHQGRDTLKNMHNDILSIKEALSRIKIEIFIEGNEIIKPQRLDGRIRVISDSVVVERNRRSVGQFERVFA